MQIQLYLTKTQSHGSVDNMSEEILIYRECMKIKKFKKVTNFAHIANLVKTKIFRDFLPHIATSHVRYEKEFIVNFFVLFYGQFPQGSTNFHKVTTLV